MSNTGDLSIFQDLASHFTRDFEADLRADNLELPRVTATAEVYRKIGVDPDMVRLARKAGCYAAFSSLYEKQTVITEEDPNVETT